MRRLPFVVAVALAVAMVAARAGTAGPSRLHVTEAKGSSFPVRTYVISLPHSLRLTTSDVSVKENGGPVAEATLVPASKASKKTFGVVLVLDTSKSMRGKPITAAIAAEQAFVDHRNRNEQLGLVDFNDKAKTILPLTTSATKMAAALASSREIGPQTHIFDAVARAEAMLIGVPISAGSIVVLSDGADTGSARTLEHVARVALANHIRIYTVGLNDKAYRPDTLEALATAGHGQYVLAKPDALTPLFGQLSRHLSNEYLLQYKSLAGPNVPIRVDVSVNGLGKASAAYRTPALPVPNSPAVPPYKHSLATRIWTSTITMVALALLGAAVIALLVIVLLQPHRSGLPQRMAEFISIRGLQREGKRTAAPAAPAGPEDGDAEERRRFWPRFARILELAEIRATPELIIAGTIAAMVLAFLLIDVVLGSPWWGLLALAVPYLVREWVLRTLKRRRDRFAEQLPDALQVVASALRSGHSFAGALAVVVESSSEPMKSEMQRVVADEQLGVPIQESLGVVAERMASRDVEQLALVAQLQREAGGDAAEVIDRVAETVRERFDLKRLIQTLTMQGRMSRWIVSALPVLVVLAIEFEDPGYLNPLTHTTGGKIVIGLAAAVAVAGSLVIKRIVEIEV